MEYLECGGACSGLRVCVCVCELCCGVCAPAFTAVPGYHERTSVSVAQAAQAAEAVTNDYTYHPRAQEAGEKRGLGWRSGKAAERVEGRAEDENVCASACLCA